jgi:hypothetical protein
LPAPALNPEARAEAAQQEPVRRKRGRPRKRETKFARWIDTHRSGHREAVAAELGIDLNHLLAVLRGDRWPGRELALSIRDLTQGEITLDELLDPAKVF